MCELCRAHRVSLSRRSLIVGAVSLLAAGSLPYVRAREAGDATKPAPNAIRPSEALERLKQGNARYAANKPKERDFSAGRAERAKAQYPIAAMLGCSDSRAVPDLVFDQGPGDLFVVQVAGNIVSTEGLASFEYAVDVLGVPLIMVLGHSNCGAIAEALHAVTSRAELPGHLPELVKAIEPAIITAHGRHSSDFLAAAVEENVRLGMKRLKTESKILSGALANGKIEVAGGVYDLATGKVNFL